MVSKEKNKEKETLTNNVEINSVSVAVANGPVVYASPVEGSIHKVFVIPGKVVSAGDVILKVDAAEGVVDITASKEGIVYNVYVINGTVVQRGTRLFQM